MNNALEIAALANEGANLRQQYERLHNQGRASPSPSLAGGSGSAQRRDDGGLYGLSERDEWLLAADKKQNRFVV